jgi:choline transport protein
MHERKEMVVEAGTRAMSDIDERELAMVGKKSVLRRNFAFLSILGFSCSLMITWEGLFSVFVFGLMNGGPGGLLYGFLLVWLGYAAVVASMGELVSMWPTAGVCTCTLSLGSFLNAMCSRGARDSIIGPIDSRQTVGRTF